MPKAIQKNDAPTSLLVGASFKKIGLEFHNFEPGKNQNDFVNLLASKQFRVILSKKYEQKAIGLIFAIRD